MECEILGGKRCALRLRMCVCFVCLLGFTVLTMLTQNTTTWETLSLLSMIQHAPGSRVLQQCGQFASTEKVHWGSLYYYQDPIKNKSLIWCKVPKAGSTTLTRMFLRLAGARKFENVGEMHVMLRTFYPELSPEVMTPRLNTTFKFVVVRHPFERILSAYRDKLENYSRDLQFQNGYFYSTYGKLMVKRPVENDIVVEPTFSEFVTYLLERSPEKYNGHWMPISTFCAPCDIHYDAIVKMENFDKEIKVPLQQAGIHEDIGRELSTGTNRNTIERYVQQLSLTQIQKLYEVYRKDFLLFGYTPNEYFSMVVHKTAKENSTLTPTLQPDA